MRVIVTAISQSRLHQRLDEALCNRDFPIALAPPSSWGLSLMTRVPAEDYRRCNALIIVSHQEGIWRAQNLVLTPPASGHALVRVILLVARLLDSCAISRYPLKPEHLTT